MIKRFREGGRDRCEREWRALTLLTTYAPGLAPEPVKLDVAAARPTVMMSRLAGEPLRGDSLSEQRIKSLAAAVRELHAALPPEVLADVPLRPGHQRELVAWIHSWAVPQILPRLSGKVGEVIGQGLSWLVCSGLGRAVSPGVPSVFGPGDGNLANYLWDGSRVRVVDFEESGRSDRAFELAEITEHAASWVEHPLDVEFFLDQCHLTTAESARLDECRRLLALVWLFMLASDDGTNPRNPPGTAERQADRLSRLLV
ncbi:aminoglycoside phosphotransferase family protein [Actinoallomurus sp. WRP9H-5]|nr:aminoglycoside phosphotransferase family protein [Actinoallomurus rhizosphaericola]